MGQIAPSDLESAVALINCQNFATNHSPFLLDSIFSQPHINALALLLSLGLAPDRLTLRNLCILHASPHDFSQLGRAIGSCPELSSLEFDELSVPAEGIGEIVSAVLRQPENAICNLKVSRPSQFRPDAIVSAFHEVRSSLVRLSFWGSGLGDEGATAIASVIPELRELEKLNMGANRLTSVGIAAVSSAVERGPGILRNLNLSQNQAGLEGAKSVARQIAAGRLRRVNIRHTELGREGAKEIADAICDKRCRLVSINMTENSVQGAKEMAIALSRTRTILKLNLATNGFDADGAALIAGALRCGDSALCCLSLAGNHLGDIGSTEIFKVLRSNRTLRRLNMSTCEIGEFGASRLGGSLSENSVLESLDLSFNMVNDEAARAIAVGLLRNRALLTLNLGWNGITHQGIDALAYAIHRRKTALRVLSLPENEAGDSGAQALAFSISSGGLIELNLWDNHIGMKGAVALADAIAKNKTLKVVDMKKNWIGVAGRNAMMAAATARMGAVTIEFD